MELYMKQKVFSWGDKFSVYDEMGNEKYYVEGEVFSFGKKLHLYSAAGNELAYIEQKIWTWLPKYNIYRDGSHVAQVVKEFTFFKQEYTVNGPDWKVHGDFFAHDYDVTKDGLMIASVSKEWFTWGDAYKISVAPGVDEATALSVVLVIDACIEAAQNNN